MFDCVLHFVSIPEKVRFKGLLSVLTSPALSRRYAAFEVPSNVLLKKLRPSVWLPLIMVLTGVVLLAQGFVSGYDSIVVQANYAHRKGPDGHCLALPRRWMVERYAQH